MDDDQQIAGLGLLANRIEGLEAQLIQMRRELAKRDRWREAQTGQRELNGRHPAVAVT